MDGISFYELRCVRKRLRTPLLVGQDGIPDSFLLSIQLVSSVPAGEKCG